MISLSRISPVAVAGALTVALCIPATNAQSLTLDIVGCTSPVATVSGGTISITGCGSAPPPAGAPSCTTTATPNPLSAGGGTVTLGVTCNPTNASLSSWTTSLSGAAINGNAMTVPANTGSSSRAVVASVQACSTDTTPVCANYNAQTTQSGTAPPPPPSGSLPTSCGNLAVVPFDGGSGNLAYEVRYDAIGMSATKVAMGMFTTGNAGSGSAQFGLADVTGTNQAYRKIYVATTACDFANAFTAGPALYPIFRYTVGANPDKSGYKDLLPNTTYYVMVKQESSTGPNCTNGGCGFSLVLHAVNNP